MEDYALAFRMSKPQEQQPLQRQSHHGNAISTEGSSATPISQVEAGSLGSVANVLSKLLALHIVHFPVLISTTLNLSFSARLRLSPDIVTPTS